jgi:hypothetical protein
MGGNFGVTLKTLFFSAHTLLKEKMGFRLNGLQWPLEVILDQNICASAFIIKYGKQN